VVQFASLFTLSLQTLDADSPKQSVRFLPQDFHTCGKHCGKTPRNGRGLSKNVDFRRVFVRRSLTERDFSGLGGRSLRHFDGTGAFG
jgi:hypothetical protein